MTGELETNHKEKTKAPSGADTQKPAYTPLSKYYREPLNVLMDDYYNRLADLESNRDRPVAWISTMLRHRHWNNFRVK